jgi:hypothetical protein
MKRTKKRGQKITWSGSHSAWQWCCGNGTASNVGKREPREIEVTVLLFPSVLLPSFLPCFSHFYHLCFLSFFFSISSVLSVHFSLCFRLLCCSFFSFIFLSLPLPPLFLSSLLFLYFSNHFWSSLPFILPFCSIWFPPVSHLSPLSFFSFLFLLYL